LPELPPAEDPEDSSTPPETPTEPTSALRIVTDPEPWLTLEPDITSTAPPVPVPTLPPLTATRPPGPTLEDPTEILMCPPDPPVAAPVEMDSHPEFAFPDLPVPIRTAPDTPADKASAVCMVTVPDPALELDPDVTVTDPPIPAPDARPLESTRLPGLPLLPEPTTTLMLPLRPPVADPDVTKT